MYFPVCFLLLRTSVQERHWRPLASLLSRCDLGYILYIPWYAAAAGSFHPTHFVLQLPPLCSLLDIFSDVRTHGRWRNKKDSAFGHGW